MECCVGLANLCPVVHLLWDVVLFIVGFYYLKGLMPLMCTCVAPAHVSPLCTSEQVVYVYYVVTPCIRYPLTFLVFPLLQMFVLKAYLFGCHTIVLMTADPKPLSEAFMKCVCFE